MDKIPIPDGWKQDYPHFIAPPSSLRLAYLAILIVTGIVFLFSCVWYYVEKDTIGSIGFFLPEEAGWDCESIGTYNGEFVFTDFDKLSVNLSQSVSIALTISVLPGSDYAGYVTGTIPTSSSLSYNISTYPLESKALAKKLEHYTFDLTWGAAPTIAKCLDMMEEGSCNTIHNASSLIHDVSVYKFTFAMSTVGNTSVTWDDLYTWDSAGDDINSLVFLFEDGFDSVFRSHVGYGGEHSPFFSYGSKYEHFVATKDASVNLCDAIVDGINNQKLFWGLKTSPTNGDYLVTGVYFTNGECIWKGGSGQCLGINDTVSFGGVQGFDISHECELISNDYCIVNASDQFVFTEDNPLETNTRIEGGSDLREAAQFLLLSPDLGTECADRWASVCLDNYDIAGYCDSVYSPPYSCTKDKRKSWWAIVSLAFASCQLATMVLVVLGGILFSKFSEPTDKTEDSVREEIEMGEDKQTNETVAPIEADETEANATGIEAEADED